jgi:hypothetical protein
MAALAQTNVKTASVFFKSLNFWPPDGAFRSRFSEKVGRKAPFFHKTAPLCVSRFFRFPRPLF